MEKLYVVYQYWDYRKETSTKILRVYKNLDSAKKYAESICINKDEDSGIEYADRYGGGKYFDRKEKDSNYGRIGVSSAVYYD